MNFELWVCSTGRSLPYKGDVCMYKTILVPVDLSHLEEGSKALEIARQIGSG